MVARSVAFYLPLQFSRSCLSLLDNYTLSGLPCYCVTPDIQADCALCTMSVQYRADKYLKTIFEEGIGSDAIFGEDNLKEVQKACNSLFNDMCQVYNCDDPGDFEPDMLNRTSAVKAQMAEWLHSAIYLLHKTCLPLMASARNKIEDLQEENISDKKEIIGLQNKLIIMKDRDLGLVSKSVVKEMKSYSSALQESCSTLQQSCSTALSPKKIASAVKTIVKEEDRSKEVLVFGVDEENGECPTSKVSKILEQLEEKPPISGCRRIGQRGADHKRPIIFRVQSTDVVYQILRKAKRLKDIEGLKTVYISPNRTPEERISRQKLVTELKKKRSDDPSGSYFIRKGEIVKADK